MASALPDTGLIMMILTPERQGKIIPKIPPGITKLPDHTALTCTPSFFHDCSFRQVTAAFKAITPIRIRYQNCNASPRISFTHCPRRWTHFHVTENEGGKQC